MNSSNNGAHFLAIIIPLPCWLSVSVVCSFSHLIRHHYWWLSCYCSCVSERPVLRASQLREKKNSTTLGGGLNPPHLFFLAAFSHTVHELLHPPWRWNDASNNNDHRKLHNIEVREIVKDPEKKNMTRMPFLELFALQHTRLTRQQQLLRVYRFRQSSTRLPLYIFSFYGGIIKSLLSPFFLAFSSSHWRA